MIKRLKKGDTLHKDTKILIIWWGIIMVLVTIAFSCGFFLGGL